MSYCTERLAEHLKRHLGVDVHPETVRQALRRLEFSWKRPRRKLPPDSDYAERIAEIDRAMSAAGAETTVLFEDETELRRFPPLRWAWMPKGEQRSVAVPERSRAGAEPCRSGAVPEQNGKLALYGALDVLTGEVIAEAYPKGRSDHTKAFLQEVLGRVEGRILLVWYNASWHVSKAVDEMINECERLEVLLLPRRAPQDNPVEDLWRELKNRVAANLERGLDALKAACRRFFEWLTPEQALRTAGLGPANVVI